MRRPSLRFLISAAVVVVILYFGVRWLNGPSSGLISGFEMPNSPRKKKLILSWTKFFGMPLDDKYFNGCPELRENCTISVDRRLYTSADAIVFHPRDMRWNETPAGRTPNQRYVFLMHEAPPHTCIDLDRNPGFFNWSFTYRLDSDVPYPYAFRTRLDSARRELDVDRVLNKSSGNASVVWLVSNCNTYSKRELYVQVLQKYLPVDIYGDCGPLKCPKSTDVSGKLKMSQCDEMIETQYKFYIAFENSVCVDYVTEKFHGRRELHSLPIVLSRRIATPIYPPNSFIAIDDYPEGPRQLADRIRYLLDNDTAYLEYFQWRTEGYEYGGQDPITGMYPGFCGLCQKLLQIEAKGTLETKVYQSVNSWWGEAASCNKTLVPKLLANELRDDPGLAAKVKQPWNHRRICG